MLEACNSPVACMPVVRAHATGDSTLLRLLAIVQVCQYEGIFVTRRMMCSSPTTVAFNKLGIGVLAGFRRNVLRRSRT